MPVLVTGGSGVVGLHVARELAAAGEEVVAYSTSGAPPRPELVLREHASRVRFEQGNILDLERLRQLVSERRIEGVVHTAALTGEAQARGRTPEVVAVNVTGTANVLEAARHAGLRRVVYVGSASEYGRRADLRPIAEEETQPQGMYAETKHLAHRLGQRYRELFGLDVITVRVSSSYGPNTRFNPYRKLVGNTLIAHLTRAAAFGEAVRLEGGGDYPRDWTYAADTAQGICRAYRVAKPRHTAYNIACGRSYTVAEVVDVLRRVAPEAQVSVGSGQWDDDPYQALNMRGPLDIARAREDLGYAPRYALAEGLSAYIAWWRAAGR
ncbi:MAG: NAD-dependent epimerase/dehydratase family protein [Burkholderiales bacterium]